MLGDLAHPQIIHLPIALAVVVPLVSAGVLLAWQRDWLPSRAWFIVVGLQVLLVGSALVALQTGETDEELAEAVVAERFIEDHEEAAERFTWAAGLLGAVMLVPLLPAVDRWRRPIAGASVAGTLIVLALGYDTGQAGGDLVYKHGAAAAFVGTDAQRGASAEEGDGAASSSDDHDDDRHDDDDD